MRRVLLISILLITLFSCERKSNRIQPRPLQTVKVVIQQDGTYVSRQNVYYYKIKILKDTTSAYLKSKYKYEKGDTLMATTLIIER